MGLGALVVPDTVKLLERTCLNTPLVTTTCITPVDRPTTVGGTKVRADMPCRSVGGMTSCRRTGPYWTVACTDA